jgi:hypothetical protein
MSGKRKMVQMSDLSDLQPVMKSGKKQNRGDKRDRQHIYERRVILVQFLAMGHECDPLIPKELILQDLEEKGYGTSKRTLERDIAYVKAQNSRRILARRIYEEKIKVCRKYLELIDLEYSLIIAKSDKKIRVATIIVDGDKERIIEESGRPSQLAYIQLRALGHRLESVKIMFKLLAGGGDIDVCLYKLKTEFERISFERKQVKSKVEKLIEKHGIANIRNKVPKEELCIDQTIKT